MSESLAKSEVHLTLEFLNEALIGFSKSNETMRQLCLDYMVPWLCNLAVFARFSSDDQKKSTTKTKDIIKLLIELTVKRNEVRYKYRQRLHLNFSYSCINTFKKKYGRHWQKWMISLIWCLIVLCNILSIMVLDPHNLKLLQIR